MQVEALFRRANMGLWLWMEKRLQEERGHGWRYFLRGIFAFRARGNSHVRHSVHVFNAAELAWGKGSM